MIFLLIAAGLPAWAQIREWTWMGGSSTIGSHCYLSWTGCGQNGVYGNSGVPDAVNIPGSRYAASGWSDGSGHLWLFGGMGFDANGNWNYLNDLWEFDPATNQWAWMGGSSTVPGSDWGRFGVYGTLGVPAAGNIPGSRLSASTWTDSRGHLWLFGGYGFDASGLSGDLNDLWEFNPGTNQWAWMGGSSTVPDSGLGYCGVYGTLGVPAAGSIPGGRHYTSTWTDSSGRLWLFGGSYDQDPDADLGWLKLNDLWEFNPATNEWAWMAGNKLVDCENPPGVSGVYGNLGVPATGNHPGIRSGASSRTDSEGHLWLFGGEGQANNTGGYLNDLWEFNPSTNEWAWMGGSGMIECRNAGCGQAGVYGTLGTPAAGNVPGSRDFAATWTDGSGHLWLLGGGGYDADANLGYLNDLWEFNPSSNLWAWMGGSSTLPELGGRPGVYGTLRTPAADNIPGARSFAVSWTDSGGHLWLFGGQGFDANGNWGNLNDLWEYQPTTTAPTFSVAAGKYRSPQGVTIQDSTPDVTVYYTLDGSTPTNHSALYDSALTIARTTTVKAIAETTEYGNSNVATATYIILKPQTITFMAPKSPVVYGEKPIGLSAMASSGLPVAFSVISGPAKVSGHVLTIAGAGTIVIAANQAGNSDFEAANEIKQEITIKKAELKVRVLNLVMTQGAAVPTLKYVIDGFVLGDTQSSATKGKPILTTTATSTSKPGHYSIDVTAGTLTAKNYSFLYSDGQLTVIP